jgi:hypothetical protein
MAAVMMRYMESCKFLQGFGNEYDEILYNSA